MKARHPPDEASPSARARRRARSRLFVLSAALLVGVAALGTAWRALALHARPNVATARSALEAIGAVDEPTSAPTAEQPTTLPEPAPASPPPPEATEPARAASPAIIAKRPTQPVTVPLIHTAPLPSAPSSATRSPSPVPSPAVAPSPTPSSRARAPEDPSGVL